MVSCHPISALTRARASRMVCGEGSALAGRCDRDADDLHGRRQAGRRVEGGRRQCACAHRASAAMPAIKDPSGNVASYPPDPSESRGVAMYPRRARTE